MPREAAEAQDQENDDAPALRLTHHLTSQISRRFARLIYLVYTIQSCTMFHEPLEDPY